MHNPSIVVLDFGSQYTQLIARRIREQNVFSVVLPCTASLAEIRSQNPLGLILSGGPSSVYDLDAPAADPEILALGLPILGICYGLQFITHHLGGKVRPAEKREYGYAEVSVAAQIPDILFSGLPSCFAAWMSHGDEALEMPAGFDITARTSNAVAGIADPQRRIWAVQFHPEVHHTPQGSALLSNFLFRICNAQPDWTPEHFIQSAVSPPSARRWATGAPSARFLAALIRRWPRCWCPAPLGGGLPVSSSTMAYCASTSSPRCSKTCAISWG